MENDFEEWNGGNQNNQQQQNNGYNGNNNNYGNNGGGYNGNANGNNGYNNNGGGSRYNGNSNNYRNQGNGGYNNNGGRNNFSGNKFKGRQEDNSEGRLYKTYVITGNRETPRDIIERMKNAATTLATKGFIMRTGGLEGVDEEMERLSLEMELYLPWRGFNNKETKFYFNTKQANDIARMFHPSYDSLKPAIHAFLAKNVRMVLGDKLKSNTMFVICWSDDGAERASERTAKTGNVGHLIAVARSLNIPVFNFGKQDAEQRLMKYLEFMNDN